MARNRSKTHKREVGSTGADAEIETSRLRLLGVGLVCAYIVLVPSVFDPAADYPFTVPKALLAHALAYLLLGVLAALFLQFGRSFLRWSPLHALVVLFLAANVAAAALAEDRALALFGTHARMLGLGTSASWIVLYFAVALLIRTRAEWIAVIAAGLCAAGVAIGYELIQIIGRDPFTWSFDAGVRPFSTNGQPTTLAQYLTVVCVGTLAFALLTPRLPALWRSTLVLYAVVLVGGSVVTGTRSALVGLATGGALLVAFLWLRTHSWRARVLSMAATAVALMVLAAFVYVSPLGARLAALSDAAGDIGSSDDALTRSEPAIAARIVLYEVALDMVRERPLLGFGPDNFVLGMPRYRPDHGADEARLSYATSAHSWVAQVGTSSGLIGLVTFLAIAAVSVGLTVRNGVQPLAASGAVMVVAFLGTGLTTVSDIGSDWMFWASVGAIAAATSTAASNPAGLQRHHRAAMRFRVLGLVCVLLGAALSLTELRAMEASRFAEMSRDASLPGRMEQAIALGMRATQADSGRAEYWQRLALAYAGASRWRDARDAFTRARALAPWDARHINDLVQTEIALASMGDANARARLPQLADDAVRTDPNYPRANYVRAVVMQFLANPAEALRSIERALALSPGSRDDFLYVTAAQIYLDAGRPADAAGVARQGLEILGTTVRTVAIRFELARALLASGQPADALGELDIVLTLQPNHPEALRLRAAIRAQLGS